MYKKLYPLSKFLLQKTNVHMSRKRSSSLQTEKTKALFYFRETEKFQILSVVQKLIQSIYKGGV